MSERRLPRSIVAGRIASGVIVSLLCLVALAGAYWIVSETADGGFTLPAIEAEVATRYREVPQMSANDLATRLRADPKPLLIDVREEAEFAVSHLEGATRAAPDVAPAQFLEKYAQQVKGRDVVFYCSVGMRSSSLAAEVQEALVKAGARGVYNLRGGLFGWHNAGRAIVDANGATEFIHPFNAKWGVLVARKETLREEK